MRVRGSTSECTELSSLRRGVLGFTLIELMVVVAIIILAAGMMTPTITDFFRNRVLERVRGVFGAAFNSARLQAVNEGGKFSIVFFREGVRIYDERQRKFFDNLFNPDNSPLGDRQVWYILGFLNKMPSTNLPRYRDWEKATNASVSRRRGAAQSAIDISMLPKITFDRDGSLIFASGADVSTVAYKEVEPSNSDIIIYQLGNNTACFIDLRTPGQFRSKTVPLSEMPERPTVDAEEEKQSLAEFMPTEDGGGSDTSTEASSGDDSGTGPTKGKEK